DPAREQQGEQGFRGHGPAYSRRRMGARPARGPHRRRGARRSRQRAVIGSRGSTFPLGFGSKALGVSKASVATGEKPKGGSPAVSGGSPAFVPRRSTKKGGSPAL